MVLYPEDPFYVVNYFGNGEPGRMSSFGFAIGLKPDIARKFYDKEIEDEKIKRMNSIGKKLIKNIFAWEKMSPKDIDTPYFFMRNERGNPTFLLQGCRVPGNACDIGIDGKGLKELIRDLDAGFQAEYTPHNVDSIIQASGLFALWNQWAIMAYAATNKN